ncbi:MAG: heat shock protein HspQ [Pseudomonadota bacterium]
MASEMSCARLQVGQPVHHKLFGYRGVIFDVDPIFQGTEEWYQVMAKSQPPKDKPWYHVLVHGAEHTTYVAEQNLEPDLTGEPIEHPLRDQLFAGIQEGLYISRQIKN